MRTDFYNDDPQRVWQTQPTETATMNATLIKQRMQQLHAKTRRQRLRTLAGPLATAFFYVFCIKQFPPLRQMLHPVFAFALAWSIAGLYFLNQGKQSGVTPEDMGFSTGLEFCRREMERQRDYVRGGLLWSFGPIFLAIVTFLLALAAIAGRAIFSNGMPLITLVVVWIAAYFWMRVRQQREIQREIDELNDIARENRR
jgi:Flp pilus assembly protein TadB